jgi:polysaccharide export outer membrane protein
MTQLYRYLVLVCLVACASTGPYVWASDLPPPPAKTSREFRLGDRIQVLVHGQDQLNSEQEVRAGGDIVVPVAGAVRAEGLTAEMLAEQIKVRLSRSFADPRVSVLLVVGRPSNVSVLGEVRSAGRYEVSDKEGVLQALARAGGLTPFADPDKIFVVRKGAGPRVRFRYADLVAGRPESVRFELQNGDVVVVE